MDIRIAPKILIVEDDPAVRLSLRITSQREGLAVIEAGSGQEALRLVAQEKPDLVLLDLLLPDVNGLDVCRAIRQQSATLPIIMLTAKNEEIDKVVGLELGADDYVTKPFSPRELIARIRAVLRRAQLRADTPGKASHEEALRFGKLTIKPAQREVTMDDRPVPLTATEFDLLAYLATNPGIALTRDQLASHVWGYDSEGDTRLLDTHIAHLRAKLEPNPSRPNYILTVRNVGYKLNPSPPTD